MDKFIRFLDNISRGNSMTLVIIIIAILVLYYVSLSYSLFMLGKKYDRNDKWMAWIPYMNLYYLGYLSYGYYYGFIMLALLTLSSFVTNGILLLVINILYLLLNSLALNKILKKYTKQYLVFTTLSILTLSLLNGLFLCGVLNKKELKYKKIMDISDEERIIDEKNVEKIVEKVIGKKIDNNQSIKKNNNTNKNNAKNSNTKKNNHKNDSVKKAAVKKTVQIKTTKKVTAKKTGVKKK